MKKIIYSLPSSFFFAFGFASQFVSLLTGKIGQLATRAAMGVSPKRIRRMKIVDECCDEVDKWENQVGRKL